MLLVVFSAPCCTVERGGSDERYRLIALVAAIAATLVGFHEAFHSFTIPKPTLVDITGNGRWTRAAGNNPDTFGFAIGPARRVPARRRVHGQLPTAVSRHGILSISHDIPSATNFTQVIRAACLSRWWVPRRQWVTFITRRSQLNDGSGNFGDALAHRRLGPRQCRPVTGKSPHLVSSHRLSDQHRRRSRRRSAPLPISLVPG